MTDQDTTALPPATDAGEYACIDVGDDEALIYQRGEPDRWLRSSRVVTVASMA